MMYNMDISTARKDLAKLVSSLPIEGIPLERYGKVVALLVRPDYTHKVIAETVEAVTTMKPKSAATPRPVKSAQIGSIESRKLSWAEIPEEFKKSVAQVNSVQKAKDDLLRRINKG